ncbi:Hsp70 family protein [Tabrizicola oligotrophica]|uniref:Hsp70 family protein n=1 Tax=Tabrizicola oligotrophica TaxID=2710650 RepID=A0A6M0QRQ7_9RHOB|nr:Hsp70 family protein [Tabrizicola oligotrophica]NEY89333.1 Hsp70 family protein [Tabrizicola oligotrophica]
MTAFCGIDFGTSNSTVSLAEDGPARLIALEGGQATLPSAVFWPDDGPLSFGRAAIATYVEGDEGRLMRGLKSTLGLGLIDERTAVGGRAVTFREVLTRFFRHLRACLDAESPGVSKVVLGRPVHFVDGDPAADAAAEAALAAIAKACGFAEVGFQFEPIAAALRYEETVAGEEIVLIVDIGGGTSDVSLVRVSPERARAADRAADVLGNGGIRLGGTDFDRSLSLAEVMPHLGHGSTLSQGKTLIPNHYFLDLATWHRINSLYAPRKMAEIKGLMQDADRPDLVGRLVRVAETRAGHALAMEVEAAKIALSGAEAVRLALKPVCGGPNPMVLRARFEAVLAPGLARIAGLIAEVLAQAGTAQVGTVFLTGGSSDLPALRGLVAELLPGVKLATGDMLGSVGAGLALEARRRFA